MASIAFFTAHDNFPWSRQLLDITGSNKIINFTINKIDNDCKLLVVYDDIKEKIETFIPRENRVVILSEPPGIKTYFPDFLDQFGIILGPVDPKNHIGQWIQSHPALPWFYGISFTKNGQVVNKTINEIISTKAPKKINAISVILSKKSKLPKHKSRIEFVEAIQKELKDKIHVFGRGFNNIIDKEEAILPYAYHLVIENNDIPHFWTEKLADAYLGWAHPIFSGCKNINDYFSKFSMTNIDISNLTSSISILRTLLNQSISTEQMLSIANSRENLVKRFSLHSVLIELATGLNAPLSRRSLEYIAPNNVYSQKNRLIAHLHSRLPFLTRL
jgi:hypothetical protein